MRYNATTPEVVTPNIDALVASGIELDRHYAFKSCSPSRCALQSGRLPVHVEVSNNLPETANANDTISGYQGIPTNMTGIAEILTRGGYRAHFVGGRLIHTNVYAVLSS